MESVIVLMSTYNGDLFLREQIDSILNQVGVNVHILVRDDGSSDRTKSILEDYKSRGLIEWYAGENLKPAKSFMNLIKRAEESRFYALCDQDDIWLPDKLEKAIQKIEKEVNDIPILYYGATTLVNQNLEPLNSKREVCAFTSFNCAVVSSNATGCTMVFNDRLRKIINGYTPDYQIMHDGWLHKVCLAVGGKVIYDETPYILYRQHSKNVIGGSSNPLKRWKRRIDTIKQNPCPRSSGIIELYKGYNNLMSEQNKQICEEIIHYRDRIQNRIKLANNKNIYSPNKRVDCLYRLTVLMGLF